MTRTALIFAFWTVVLVLAQAVIFNHICILNVAMPFVFIYMILRMPITMSQNWALTIAFAMGLTVDIFADTQGMNSLACTVLAGVRLKVLRLYYPREEDLSYPQPSIRSLGAAAYAKYAVTMSLVFCTVLFLIESLSLFNPVRLALRIVSSTVLTTILLIGIDSLTLRRGEKRL